MGMSSRRLRPLGTGMAKATQYSAGDNRVNQLGTVKQERFA